MKISNDTYVEYTYTITDQDNNVVEEAEHPVNYVHGYQCGMHDKIKTAMEGRRDGDQIIVSLDSTEGFGPKDPSLILTEDINSVPENMRSIGSQADFTNEKGESRPFRVTNISDGKVTLDGNHPLAGQPLTFTLKVLTVREATQAELAAQNQALQSAEMTPSKPLH